MNTLCFSSSCCRQIPTDKFHNDLLIHLFSHMLTTTVSESSEWPVDWLASQLADDGPNSHPLFYTNAENHSLKSHSIHFIIKTRTKLFYSIATHCIQSVPFSSTVLRLFCINQSLMFTQNGIPTVFSLSVWRNKTMSAFTTHIPHVRILFHSGYETTLNSRTYRQTHAHTQQNRQSNEISRQLCNFFARLKIIRCIWFGLK